MSGMRWWIVMLCLLVCPLLALAEEPEQQYPSAQEFLESLKPTMGTIELPNKVAQLDVPDSFRYIGPDAAKRFLEEGWGNPHGDGTLGMLLPVDTDLFGAEGWAVVITYQDDGYVSDEDAADIDYAELLASMQDATREANNQRREQGYEPVNLVGWAAPPHYDAEAKKLYWAKELRFGDNAEHNTLNYNVRILGRKGVLVLNAVSDMGQLPVVEQNMTQVLAFTNFKDGHRYADFDPSIDKVAGYGLAALIGGKVAAKAGLFAKLGAILLASKKLIVVAFVGLAAALGKIFRRRKIIAEPTRAPDMES